MRHLTLEDLYWSGLTRMAVWTAVLAPAERLMRVSGAAPMPASMLFLTLPCSLTAKSLLPVEYLPLSMQLLTLEASHWPAFLRMGAWTPILARMAQAPLKLNLDQIPRLGFGNLWMKLKIFSGPVSPCFQMEIFSWLDIVMGCISGIGFMRRLADGIPIDLFVWFIVQTVTSKAVTIPEVQIEIPEVAQLEYHHLSAIAVKVNTPFLMMWWCINQAMSPRSL